MKTYKHVLALNPYFGDSTALMGVFPPTGLEYIAASVKDWVGKITLLDLRYERMYQNPERLSRFIRDEFDLVLISIRWSTRFRSICEFVSKLPTEVTTVVGGYQATLEVDQILARCPNVDVVVRGEGEEVIKEVVTGIPYANIRGLSYRHGEKIIHNDNHALPDVAGIPFPDRSLRRHDYYWRTERGVRLGQRSYDTILTTRGCPFKCKFCTFSLNPLGQKRRYTERSVESIIDELKQVTADFILFSDDNFFTNPKRSERLCDLIIENKIKKTFAVQARIDIAKHPRVLEKAEKAGFRVFLIGIESPHDWILEQMQKGITQRQIRDAFAVLTRFNFFLHGYFIYGNIGETDEEMLYIAEFAREIGIDTISFQKLRIEKFSPLKDIVDAHPDYYYKRVGGPVYSKRNGKQELKQIRNRIRSGFYTPAQIVHIIRKAGRTGIVGWSDLISMIPRLPWLLAGFTGTRTKKRAEKRTERVRQASLSV
jgi:magnesium-protoporphyrin IX monomethyl ester (oxidative) cyclase